MVESAAPREERHLSGAAQGTTVGGTQILDTITAPWDGWDDFKYSVRCTWECDMPGNGSLAANLAALPFIPVVRVEAATARLGSKLYDIIRTGELLLQDFISTAECSTRGLEQHTWL